jgi:competence protein ComEC
VHPELAVISLSADNPYGHPHRETQDRLKAAGPVVLRTDRDGTILVRSDGAGYAVVTEKGEGDIWNNQTPVPPAAGTTAPVLSPSQTVATVTTPPTSSGSIPVTIPTLPSTISIPVPSLTLPPVQIGTAASVRISAVQFNAPGDDRQNLNGEWVRLTNTGEGPVLIAGWTLTDRNNRDPYTFPAVVLLPATSVTVYVGSGAMNDTALFMGKSEPLFSNSGDEAILQDGSGTIIDWRTDG